MYKLHILLFSVLMLGGLASCNNTTVDPSADAGTIFTANTNDIRTYATTKGLSGTTTSSGLYFALTKANSLSAQAAYGQELEFNYRLYVLNGPSNTTTTSGVTDLLIDTTYQTIPAYFPFFSGALLPGLEEGLLKMHEGEQAVMLMPSILAFGSTANGSIPANSPVRFDVKLNRARTEDQQINEYIAANKLTVTDQSADGVRFILVTPNPTGKVPTAGQTLTINFAGKLLRASTGFAGGTGSDTKTVGVNKYVAGFEAGLAKLKVGEKATVIFPSSLGYGATGAAQNGAYVIPPYSPIRFDIELVAAQ
jgi:FKBP-type peptidyl-prolyl cis-trans isomerase